MSNSALVDYTRLSPNCTKPRRGKISKITIHHMAGNLMVEQCGEVFAGIRKASANYGIDSDGRVGLYVEECNRAWTSSSSANDDVAVTIEVANSVAAEPWPVSQAAYDKLIELCADICRRNGIEKLNYTGDKSGNLTMHKWFAATACPGPYLEARFPDIAAKVNALLASDKADVSTGASFWAEEACRLAVEKGLVKGDGAGNYNWQEPVTREALMTILHRAGVL